MNIAANDRISEAPQFTYQFVPFSTNSGGEQPASRLSPDQLDAFLNAASENARSAHFFTAPPEPPAERSEEHTSELQSQSNIVCRFLLEKKNEFYDAMLI